MDSNLICHEINVMGKAFCQQWVLPKKPPDGHAYVDLAKKRESDEWLADHYIDYFSD